MTECASLCLARSAPGCCDVGFSELYASVEDCMQCARALARQMFADAGLGKHSTGVSSQPLAGQSLAGSQQPSVSTSGALASACMLHEHSDQPAGCRGTFKADASLMQPLQGTGERHFPDTFLSTPGWSKGVAFINGFNLGWYWPAAGPQMTLYIPGPLIQPGENQLILFELETAPHDALGKA